MRFLMRCNLNDKQKQFLIYRSEGLSFDKIALQLKTSKSTLMQWSRLFQDDINDLQFMMMKRLKEEYTHTKAKQYEQLLKHLQKVDKAIEDAELSITPLKDLILVRNDLSNRLYQMENKTVYTNTNVVETCEYTGTKKQLTLNLNEL